MADRHAEALQSLHQLQAGLSLCKLLAVRLKQCLQHGQAAVGERSVPLLVPTLEHGVALCSLIAERWGRLKPPWAIAGMAGMGTQRPAKLVAPHRVAAWCSAAGGLTCSAAT